MGTAEFKQEKDGLIFVFYESSEGEGWIWGTS